MNDFIASVVVLVCFGVLLYGLLLHTESQQAQWEERKRKREEENSVD